MSYTPNKNETTKRFLLYDILAEFVKERLRHTSGSAAKVWLVLLFCIDWHDGIAYPSVSKISEYAGVSRSTVSESLKSLREVGDFVVIEPGGPGRSTRRKLKIPPPNKHGRPKRDIPRSRVAYPAEPGAHIPPGRDRTSSRTDSYNHKDKSFFCDGSGVRSGIDSETGEISDDEFVERLGDYNPSDSTLDELASRAYSFGVTKRSWARRQLAAICEEHGVAAARKILRWLEYRKERRDFDDSLGGIAGKALKDPEWALAKAKQLRNKKKRKKKSKRVRVFDD